MRPGIAHRFALLFSVLVFLATATVGFSVYQGARQALIAAATDRLAHTAEVVEVRFQSGLDAIVRDVRFLAKTPPVQGIVRVRRLGRRGDRLDPETAISDYEWRAQLADVFTVFLENRPSYLAIHFAEIAGDGQELVRVERRDSLIHPVPRRQLQHVGEQVDFQETFGLPQGAAYLSPVNLEQTSVIMPGVFPHARIGLPIYTAAGKPFGALMIDVDLRDMLYALKDLAAPDKTLYLANETGALLMQSDADKVADLAPGGPSSIKAVFPELAPLLAGETPSLRIERALVGKEKAVSAYFERISFSRSPVYNTVIVGVTSPHDAILAGVRDVRNRSVLITLLFALIGIGLALTLSGLLTRPLSRVTRAISRFGRDGWETALPTGRQDEIGMLARTFMTMAEQIQQQVLELENKERRQRTILETSAEGIIVTDAQGTVETFNASAEHILGYNAQDVVGQNISLLIAPQADGANRPDARNGTPAEAWMDLRQGGEAVGRRQDGHAVPLSVTWSTFELAGEQKYTVLLQDITERKAAETLREQLLKELERERRRLKRLSKSLEVRVRQRTADLARTNKALQQRNRELQDFAYVASHDLQEPLRKIQAFAGLLRSEYGSRMDKEGSFYIERMQDAAGRMSRLISELLTYSRITTRGKPYEAVDLNRIVEEVLSDLEISLREARGRVHVEPLPTIEADPTQMRQLFQNLISNALKFRRPDVPPVIHVRGRTQQEGALPEVSGPACRLEVEDNGIGFEEKYAERIFSPFQRLHGRSAYEGTGMGLAICRRIAERHEGTISAQSRPGVGTTFIITLPLRQRRTVAAGAMQTGEA